MAQDYFGPTFNALENLKGAAQTKYNVGRQNALDAMSREDRARNINRQNALDALNRRNIEFNQQQSLQQGNRQNKLFQMQVKENEQKQAIERINILGPIAEGILKSPNPEQEYQNATQMLQQQFPEYAGKLPGTLQEALPQVQQLTQVYRSMNPTKYSIIDGQYIPTQPGTGEAKQIPGFIKDNKNEGEIREIKKGDQVITQEFSGGEWREVALSPRFAPEKGKRVYGENGQIIYEEGPQAEKGKILPSSMVDIITESKQLPIVLAPVREILDEKPELFGPVQGQMTSRNPYAKETQKAQADLKIAAQVIGRFMEGGVLRKEDEEKYRKMLPNITDDIEVARYKQQAVENMLAEKSSQYIKDYSSAGYDTSGFPQNKISKTKEKEEIGVTTSKMDKQAFMKKWFNR